MLPRNTRLEISRFTNPWCLAHRQRAKDKNKDRTQQPMVRATNCLVRDIISLYSDLHLRVDGALRPRPCPACRRLTDLETVPLRIGAQIKQLRSDKKNVGENMDPYS